MSILFLPYEKNLGPTFDLNLVNIFVCLERKVLENVLTLGYWRKRKKDILPSDRSIFTLTFLNNFDMHTILFDFWKNIRTDFIIF